MPTNLELVEHTRRALRENWGYMLGGFCQVLTEALLKQKMSQGYKVGEYNTKWGAYLRGFLGRRTTDCYGLIKGCVWWNGGDVIYVSHQDRNQEGAFEAATEKGPLLGIPEIPGLCLYMNGHAGIYVGNGELIECIGAPKGMTLARIVNGKVSGGSNFTHWFKDTFITYPAPISDLNTISCLH